MIRAMTKTPLLLCKQGFSFSLLCAKGKLRAPDQTTISEKHCRSGSQILF